MKDLFSTDSQRYQQARPTYPPSLLQSLLQYIPERELAWDCGAGSGQLTHMLASYFDQVVGTDISQTQLSHAEYYDNISYQLQPAENTTFPDHCFDLITVAQAIHWFDFEAFYAEVRRTIKPSGILAVVGYGLIHVDDLEINAKVQHLYHQTLNGFWDAERHYVDELYQTIPFPFDEIEMPAFQIEAQWTLQQLLQYLNTWSAVQHYILEKNLDPVEQLLSKGRDLQDQVSIQFPVLLRVGRCS